MDKKSKILFTILALMAAVSVGATYYKIMIQRDYQIVAQISCDPAAESCFTHTCDPEYEECSDIPEENISYYKLINKNAANITICDSSKGEECAELACEAGEQNCEITLCSEETAEDDPCSNPEEYLQTQTQQEEQSSVGEQSTTESEFPVDSTDQSETVK